MTEFLLHIAWLSLSLSAVILLVLLFNRAFGKRFSAKSRYVVWVVVILSLCAGTALFRLPSLFTFEVEIPEFEQKEPEMLENIETEPAGTDKIDQGAVIAPVTQPGVLPETGNGIPSHTEVSAPETQPTVERPPVQIPEPVIPALPESREDAGQVPSSEEAPEKKIELSDIAAFIFAVWLLGAIFSMSEGKPVLLDDYRGRKRGYLNSEGCIYVYSSGGATVSSESIYRIAADCRSLELIHEIGSSDIDLYYYLSNGKKVNISASEFDLMRKKEPYIPEESINTFENSGVKFIKLT